MSPDMITNYAVALQKSFNINNQSTPKKASKNTKTSREISDYSKF